MDMMDFCFGVCESVFEFEWKLGEGGFEEERLNEKKKGGRRREGARYL
jgi:hypothetical protein